MMGIYHSPQVNSRPCCITLYRPGPRGSGLIVFHKLCAPHPLPNRGVDLPLMAKIRILLPTAHVTRAPNQEALPCQIVRHRSQPNARSVPHGQVPDIFVPVEQGFGAALY